MDLKFSEMSVDTTLAQEYLKKNEFLLILENDYNGTIEKYSKNEEDFIRLPRTRNTVKNKNLQTVFQNMASKLKENATLIAQLEYHIRNIPIGETHAQLNLLIQYFRSVPNPEIIGIRQLIYGPDVTLLVLMFGIAHLTPYPIVKSKVPVAIFHLLVTLYREAGSPIFVQLNKQTEDVDTFDFTFEGRPVRDRINSGTVAVVSDDADVDSAVDKFISVSKKVPWRLTKILVQETVYQEFKEALTWKCKLHQSGSEVPNRNILCSDTLTYNDTTFLIDPVELSQELEVRGVVIVEAYRTTKEMISLVQQYKPRYLSLWINGIAEINEVVHSTMAPIVWVNTVADFRGPPQVSHAVFSLGNTVAIKKCDKVAKLCELSQSWLKLNLESRREILCGMLDDYIMVDPENKDTYTKIRNSISSFTQKCFVDVGKDYVCTGMAQSRGIIIMFPPPKGELFSVKGFEAILQGNAVIVVGTSCPQYSAFELKGVPVVHLDRYVHGDLSASIWDYTNFMGTRFIWTNSGTIFAN